MAGSMDMYMKKLVNRLGSHFPEAKKVTITAAVDPVPLAQNDDRATLVAEDDGPGVSETYDGTMEAFDVERKSE